MNNILLARQLRELADQLERGTNPHLVADVGIRLAEMSSWWRRVHDAEPEPLSACRDPDATHLALVV